MNEVYWLTRLGALDNFLTFAEVVLALMIAALLIVFIMTLGDDAEANLKEKRHLVRCSLILSVICLVDAFIPSQKEAYAILGIGGTIDYIKSNDKAKQIPDKCVDALDRFIDSYTKDKEKE